MRVEISKALARIVALLVADQTDTLPSMHFPFVNTVPRSDNCDNAVTIK